MKNRIFQIVVCLIAVLLLALLASKCSRKGESDYTELAFVVPSGGFTVEHDYNQQRFVGIENRGSGVANVRLLAEGPSEVPSGFVGRGTDDWEVPDTLLSIGPGETWNAPLLIHADRANVDKFKLLLMARYGVDGAREVSEEVEVRIETPRLELETTWLEVEDPALKARLMKKLRVRNVGASVGDLSIEFENEGGSGRVGFEPRLEFTRLGKGQEIDVLVRPKLTPWFKSIAGEVVLTGLNQAVRVPYAACVAEGEQVFVTLSRSTGYSSNSGSRCTNRKSVDYSMDPTGGTPGPNPEPTTVGEIFGGRPGSTGGQSGGAIDSDPWPDEWTSTENPELKAEVAENAETKPNPDSKTGGKPEQASDPDRGKEPKPGKSSKPVIIDMPLGEDEILKDPEYGRSLSTEYLMESNSDGLITDMLAPVLNSDDFGAITHIDDQGRRTHLVRESTGDNTGAQFLNFSFGIQPGQKRRVPVRIDYPISSPSLGPSSGSNGGAAAIYTKENGEGETVVEVLDPWTGKSAETGPGETPKLTPQGAVYLEDGKLRRSALDSDLAATRDQEWPLSGVESGPILEVVGDLENESWLLTKEADGQVAVRKPDGTVRQLAGRDASLGMLAGVPMVALLRDDGRIDAVNAQGGETNIVPSSPDNGSPTLLATGDGALRLYFHRKLPDESLASATGVDAGGAFAVEYRDGEWGMPKRVFQVQPSVTNAAVVLNFDAPFGSAHYKPMNTEIKLNNYGIGRLDAKVPSGRFVFHAPPSKLFYDSPGSAATAQDNRVQIDTVGVGPGNFHLTDHCAIYTKHDFVEECLVAVSAEEANRLAQLSTTQMRHAAPDLMVASNGWEIPRDVEPGQRISFEVGLFNSGDRPAAAGKLTASVFGQKVGEAVRPEVAPFTGIVQMIEVELPDDWNPDESLVVRVMAELPGDVNAEDNFLDLGLFRALQPGIAGPDTPIAADVSTINPIVIPQSAENAFETVLDGSENWYQTEIPPEGDLLLEVTGPGAGMIDRIDLFDGDGNYLQPDRGTWATESKILNLRIGLPPNVSLPEGTLLRIRWSAEDNDEF